MKLKERRNKIRKEMNEVRKCEMKEIMKGKFK